MPGGKVRSLVSGERSLLIFFFTMGDGAESKIVPFLRGPSRRKKSRSQWWHMWSGIKIPRGKRSRCVSTIEVNADSSSVPTLKLKNVKAESDSGVVAFKTWSSSVAERQSQTFPPVGRSLMVLEGDEVLVVVVLLVAVLVIAELLVVVSSDLFFVIGKFLRTAGDGDVFMVIVLEAGKVVNTLSPKSSAS